MSIRRVVDCDGPRCGVSTDTPTSRDDSWPDGFILVKLMQARDGMGATGVFGFCSRNCLIIWAAEHGVRS